MSKCVVLYADGAVVVADFPLYDHVRMELVSSIASGTLAIVDFNDFDGLPCWLWGDCFGDMNGKAYNHAASWLTSMTYQEDNCIYGDVVLLPAVDQLSWNGFDADRATQLAKDIKFLVHSNKCRAMSALN